MSQAKVDKYKEEKKNRAKTLKKKKIAKVAGILIAALGVGAIIGIPLGKFIYTTKKAEEDRKRTVVSDNFETWFNEFWGKNYSDIMGASNYQDILDQLNQASGTDATADDASEDVEFDHGENGSDDTDVDLDEISVGDDAEE